MEPLKSIVLSRHEEQSISSERSWFKYAICTGIIFTGFHRLWRSV